MFTVKVFDEKGMEVKVVKGEFIFVVAGENYQEKADSVLIGKTSRNYFSRVGINELIKSCMSISINDGEDGELSLLAHMIKRLTEKFNSISKKKGYTYEDIEKLK